MNVLKSIKFTNERSINALYYCVLEHNIEMIEACQYAYVMGLIDDNDVLESEKKWVELYKNEKKPLFLQTLNHLESITAARECFTPDVPLSQFAGIPTRYSLPFDISFHETADFVNYLMFKDIKPPNSLIAFPDDNILYQLPASLLESDDCFVFVNYFDLKQYFRQIINGYFSESLYLTPINTKKDYQVWYYFGVLLGNLSLTGSHFKLPLPLHPLIYASLTCSNVTDTFNDISDDLIEEYLLASNPKQITRIRTKAYNALEKGQFNESLMSNDLQSAWKQVYDEYIDILEKINQGFYDYAKHKEPKLKDFTSFSIQSVIFWFEGLTYTNELLKQTFENSKFQFRVFNLNMKFEELNDARKQYINWSKNNTELFVEVITMIASQRFFNPLFFQNSVILFLPENDETFAPKFIYDTNQLALPAMFNKDEELNNEKIGKLMKECIERRNFVTNICLKDFLPSFTRLVKIYSDEEVEEFY